MKSVSCRSKLNDMLLYFQYLEEWKLPENERDACRIMFKSQKMEVINGVLQHASAADRSTAVVCCGAKRVTTSEAHAHAHASLFSGHLSEWKVYDRLHRRFWWQGTLADIQ